MKATTAIVVPAEETEQQLIDRAKRALTQCSWDIGECASQWVRKHAKGRTDADFADLIGMERTQVAQRRAVFEKYEKCDLNHTFGDGGSVNLRDVLSGTHFYVAMNWDDAKTCLSWAADMEATVVEMKAWRRATHGDDLTEDSEPEPETLEPIVAPVKPVTAARPPEEPAQPARLTEPVERSTERKSATRPAGRSQHDQDGDFSRLMAVLEELTDRISQVDDREALAERLRSLADKLYPMES